MGLIKDILGGQQRRLQAGHKRHIRDAVTTAVREVPPETPAALGSSPQGADTQAQSRS